MPRLKYLPPQPIRPELEAYGSGHQGFENFRLVYNDGRVRPISTTLGQRLFLEKWERMRDGAGGQGLAHAKG